MNKLTTIKTIKKAAPLALLAVVMSGSALAGPKGDRPKGPKFSIDVENFCEVNEDNGRYLDVTTTVTPSGSQPGDGGGEVGTPKADAAFKGEVCETNKGGKEKCSQDFIPAGDAQYMYLSDGNWVKSIDLCATKPGETLSKGTAINALISVPVKVDGKVQATWVSRCDDLDIYPDDYAWVNGEYVDDNDQSNVNLEEDIVCPTPAE